ncbi:hypothetical protein DY000_02052916 [Brassica cretica]|uniref:Uncharacterized protein n=1 Tax=Brassica cretica TaxID=69181 RepID=A0ABQ7AIC3_BRACR|nr:hypothetical protein DY000_02052916 [Brassica cretica]
MRYRVRLPDLDAHRLKETQNPSQTLVCLKTTQKIIEKRVKSRKPYIPIHLRREVNKEELEGFHKRVKRVPKDMSFEDAYHKYRLGNFFRESRETDKDIGLLFNKSHSDFAARHPHPPTLARVTLDDVNRQQHEKIDRHQHGSVDQQQKKSSDRQPSMPYRVRLPDLDAHRLKETQNPSQTSVSLKTIEKISPQSAEAPEQEKSTLAETSFVESVDRRHLPSIDRRHLLGIDQHQTDRYEPAMERQATKEEISVENRVKSRKPYIPKHLRREVNKEELEGFHKRVKRVPKDMSFEDAYHKYRLGNFFRESRETDKDIGLLFNKVSLSIMAIDTAELLGLKMEPSKDSITFVDSSRVKSAGMITNVKVEIWECIILVDFHAMDIKSGKTSPLLFGRAFMATVWAVCDLKRNKMCLTNVDETVFYEPTEKKKSEELISCIEMFEDAGPTADSNREPAKPKSVSFDIRIAASVDIQSSKSIDNKPSASDDSQSSESIDTKPSASVDTLRLSEQPKTEKSKSGG